MCLSLHIFKFSDPPRQSKFKITYKWNLNLVMRGHMDNIWWFKALRTNYLRTPTSFLKACIWAGLGSITLSFFTATGPCQWALNTIPNDPDPICLSYIISLYGISQSSFESLLGLCVGRSQKDPIQVDVILNAILFVKNHLKECEA